MKVAREVIEQLVTIDNIYYYTDSMTAFCWINNTFQQYKQFVEERVIKIRNLSKRWRHVKGTENPADLTSRGLLATQLKETAVDEGYGMVDASPRKMAGQGV